MPVVVAWIGEMLLSVVGQLALSALVSIGIGFAANAAASGFVDNTGIGSMLASSGPMVQYIGWLGLDKAVTIILSAWAGRAIVSAARVHLASKRAAAPAP